MSAKSIVAVIMVAVLIGVVYVLFEKSFSGNSTLSNSKTASSQELSKKNTPGASVSLEKTSVISYPSPEASPAPIDSSTDLLKTTNSLEMRDYSGLFEDLKDSVSK